MMDRLSCKSYLLKDEELENLVDNFIKSLEVLSARGPDFLRAPVFQMIKKYMDKGHQRVRDFMSDLAAEGSARAKAEVVP